MITDDLYDAIKRQLKKAKEPVTCNDILDSFDVQQLEDVTGDDVSNALAALWRRGILERFSVQRGYGRGPRYSYRIRKDKGIDPQHVPTVKPLNVEKIDVQQNADGSVVLKTERLLITIKPFKN